MTDKMISFLKHLNIENIDDFDIDFEMVARNRFNREQIDMMIVKNTPWKYHLLREFQDALNGLTYPYLLRFSYLVRPDMNDLVKLFEDWYQTLYRIPHNLELDASNDNYLKIIYANEAEKLDKTAPGAHFVKGMTAAAEKNYPEAYRYTKLAYDAFEQAVLRQDIDEDDADYLMIQTQLAMCLARMGNTKEALVLMERLQNRYKDNE